MSSAREKILKTASELMEKQGYHGTGLNEIIQTSGAPKGSLYYWLRNAWRRQISILAPR
jgi:TetR/AcrR family transcriptional repressor of lmrAB and yxaGH operons